MGLLDLIKNNYPGKKGAVKATTKRVLHEVANALEDYSRENPNLPSEPDTLYRILQSPDFHHKLIVQSWTGKEMGWAELIIPEPPEEFKDNIYGLFLNIVWNIVRFELSYDPTMGTEKDFRTVKNMVERFVDENLSD